MVRLSNHGLEIRGPATTVLQGWVTVTNNCFCNWAVVNQWPSHLEGLLATTLEAHPRFNVPTVLSDYPQV